MKRLPLILATLTALAATTAHAVTWQKTFEGSGFCVQETSDGNYVVVGAKDNNLRLLKIDTLGNTLWSKTYEEYGYRVGKWVQQTIDGDYIIAARIPSLLKTNAQGEIIWAEDFDMYGYCVQQTSNSGYIVACGDNGNGGDTYLALVKTNSEGDTLWTHTYVEPGHDFNTGFFVQQTSDSGYIITGKTDYVQGEGEFVSGYLWLVKTDPGGSVQWTKTYGTGGNYEFNIGRCVRETSDGNYIITGKKGFSPEGFWLLKTDQNGDTLWALTFEGESGNCVIESPDGNYVAVGRGQAASIWESSLPNGGDVLLIEVDPDGNTIWTRNHGGDDVDLGECVDQTSDGGYIIIGWSNSFNPVIRQGYTF